jgi:hypothetical protein
MQEKIGDLIIFVKLFIQNGNRRVVTGLIYANMAKQERLFCECCKIASFLQKIIQASCCFDTKHPIFAT